MTTVEPDEESSRVESEERAISSRVGGLLRRSGGVARDGAWQLSHEFVALAATLLSFALLTSELGPADYGGLDYMHVPMSRLWMPELWLYHRCSHLQCL